MSRSVAEKMLLKPEMRTWLENAPSHLLDTINAPDLDFVDRLEGSFRYVHLFVKTQSDMNAKFPQLRKHLGRDGALWVSWPKGHGPGTDLNLHEVIQIGYSHGLVESTCLSIDDTWSALRFTHPKPGKIYANGHADLNLDASEDGDTV